MPSVVKTAEKIESFAKWQDGWAYGKGRAASSNAVRLALKLNARAKDLGFFRTNAFLAEDGGVQLVIYEWQGAEDVEYELNITPAGSIDFAVLIRGGDVAFYEAITSEEAISKLEDCAFGLCDYLSDLSTLATTTKKNTDFVAPPLPRQTTEVFPSSTSNVPLPKVGSYVPTLISTTPLTFAVLRRSIGTSRSVSLPYSLNKKTASQATSAITT